MNTWADKTCKDTVWITPDHVIKQLEEYFDGPIPLDAATESSNPTGALKFYTEKDNGLLQPWDTGTFINPPYGSGIKDWCEKIHNEATRIARRPIIALLPCGSGRPGTRYWQDHIFVKELLVICYIRGRLSFKDSNLRIRKSNTFPSHILGFNVNVDKFIKCFKDLGKTMKTTIIN